MSDDDIHCLLGNGGSKQYISVVQPTKDVSKMQKWLLENESTIVEEEIASQKFTEYMSWQSVTAESTPE
jgi:tRNA A22 N-methylase